MIRRFVLFLILLIPVVGYGQEVYQVSWEDPGGPKINIHHFTNEPEARAKADSLVDFFAKRGFLEVQMNYLAKGDTGLYSLNLGPIYSWEFVDTSEIPLSYQSQMGQPRLDYPEPFQWIDHLLSLAENQGYPFAESKVDSLKIHEHRLSGKIVFDPGPYIVWDSLELLSGSKTKVSYLQQLSGLEPGKAFSQDQFVKAIDRIGRSPYFSVSGKPELYFQQKSARPILSLSDKRINVFDGVIGFLPNENEPGKLLVTGEVDLQLFHLGGKGRDISLLWQRLNLQSQALDLAYKESFIFRTALDFSTRFSLLKQDSTFVNRTFEVNFGYRLSSKAYLSFFTKRQAGDLIEINPEAGSLTLPEAIDYRWNHYGLQGTFETLDDLIFPRKGFRFQGQFSAGNKRILENTAISEDLYQGLEKNSAQYQGWFKSEQHMPMNKFWGMYLALAGGFVQNNQLFLNELYRIGGLKSIRGFNEKFFFAKNYGYLTFEQRLFFAQNSYLHAFTDIGLIDNPYFSTEIDRPISFGAGINLDTGGGLFSFVFALGKSNAQPLSFEYARIHFGYLARF